MAWDYYTIVARKRQKGSNQELDILSIWRNGKEYKKMESGGIQKPNFDGPDPPDTFKDCIYVGGAEENRCRWVWGKWW